MSSSPSCTTHWRRQWCWPQLLISRRAPDVPPETKEPKRAGSTLPSGPLFPRNLQDGPCGAWENTLTFPPLVWDRFGLRPSLLLPAVFLLLDSWASCREPSVTIFPKALSQICRFQPARRAFQGDGQTHASC